MSEAAATRRTAGVITDRASVKVTWYLDPADAEGPGLYVAVDYRGNYAKDNLLKGYVIWYRAPGASEFRLMRVEDNYIPKGALPALAAGAMPIEEGATPLPESNSNVIGYKTVADARAALTARKDVQMETTAAGWLIVQVPSENTIWSFTPPAHPAYPAAVKRTFFESKGSVQLQTNALCQASKKSCDQLIRDFQRLNDQMKNAIHAQHEHSSPDEPKH